MEPILNSPRLTQFGPQPAPADAAPLDLIFIEGFRGETVIGIHESELHRPQPLVIDLQAGLPRAMACSTDHIADTIDYGVVRGRLQDLMHNHGVTLLEALALLETTSVSVLWSLVIIVSVHLFMSEWPRMRQGLISLAPVEYQDDMHELYARLREVWMAYLRGQIVLMVVVGI